MLIDNCPAHPKIELSNIKLVFFPVNCTSVLQPMDQGVIATFKQYYRRIVLQKLIITMESQPAPSEGNTDIAKAFKDKFTLLEALRVVKTAWGFCTESTIANCFRHAGFVLVDATSGARVIETESESESEATEYTVTFNRAAAALGGEVCSAVEFVAFDSEVTTTKELTTKEIVANLRPSQEEEEEEEEEEESPPLPVPTASKCLEMLEEVNRYIMTCEHAHEMLTNIDAIAVFTRSQLDKNKKQCSMADFF